MEEVRAREVFQLVVFLIVLSCKVFLRVWPSAYLAGRRLRTPWWQAQGTSTC